jgi:hypothetical protein
VIKASTVERPGTERLDMAADHRLNSGREVGSEPLCFSYEGVPCGHSDSR